MTDFLRKRIKTLDKEHPKLHTLCKQHIRFLDNAYCIIPSFLTHTYTCDLIAKEMLERKSKAHYAQLTLQFSALCNWRYTKSIYRFDETLLSALVMQKLDEIPVLLFYQLRESAFFIEIPQSSGIERYLHQGFFVYFDYRDENYFLRLVFLNNDERKDKEMSLLEIPLDTNQTIQQAIAELLSGLDMSIDMLSRNYYEKRLRMALNIVLYLCAENTDFSKRKEPSRPQTYTEPKSEHYHSVGAVDSKLLRTYNENVNKSYLDGKKRPHMRSAHWHTYWTGKGRQIPKLIWLYPIFVHHKDDS